MTHVNRWLVVDGKKLTKLQIVTLRLAVIADIKEALPTVRAKRPAQQAKAKIKPSCNRQCYFMSGGFCHKSKVCGDQMAA